jgi:hypothetical protein
MKKSIRNEEGVIALLTLGFFMACGLVLIVLLWGISFATGAYNTLYISTQSAARSAAQVTERQSGNSQQPSFACDSGPAIMSNRFTCGGPVALDKNDSFDAAYESLNAALNPGQNGQDGVPGRFGLIGPGYTPKGTEVQVKMLGPGFNPCPSNQNCISLYSFGFSSANQRDQARSICEPWDDNSEYKLLSNGQGLACWSLPGTGGIDFGANYESGVVVRTRADITIPPGCTAWFCPFLLVSVAAAAKQSQISAPNEYKCYTDPNPPDDCYDRTD